MTTSPRLLPMVSTDWACCAPAPSTDQTPGRAAFTPGTSTAPGAARYRVQGMTCGHCAAAVTEELDAVDGVTSLDVDLVAGGVSTVTVIGTVNPDAVRSAIAEAGYTPIA